MAFDAIGFGKCLFAAENDDNDRDEEEEADDHNGEKVGESLENGEQSDEGTDVFLLIEVSSGDRSDHTR